MYLIQVRKRVKIFVIPYQCSLIIKKDSLNSDLIPASPTIVTTRPMTDKLQPNIDIICRTNSSLPVNCEVVLCKRRLELCFLYDIELQKTFRISITMNMYIKTLN